MDGFWPAQADAKYTFHPLGVPSAKRRWRDGASRGVVRIPDPHETDSESTRSESASTPKYAYTLLLWDQLWLCACSGTAGSPLVVVLVAML